MSSRCSVFAITFAARSSWLWVSGREARPDATAPVRARLLVDG
jgi:hypothetical protein